MDEYFVEEKSSFDKFMDLLVFFAVFIVTIFLILDLLENAGKFSYKNLENIYFYVNIVIFAIFFVDLVRLKKASSGWKDFFKKNWLDVLATIPYGLLGMAFANLQVLNVLKWGRVVSMSSKLSKVSRAAKIGKEFKAASHLKKDSDEYKRKHRL